MFQFQVGCSILGVYLKYAHKYTSSILKTNLIPTKKYTFCILFAVYFDYIKCILQVYYKMVRELVHLSKILLQWLCNRENGKKIKNIMIKRLLIFNKLVLDKTEAEINQPHLKHQRCPHKCLTCEPLGKVWGKFGKFNLT